MKKPRSCYRLALSFLQWSMAMDISNQIKKKHLERRATTKLQKNGWCWINMMKTWASSTAATYWTNRTSSLSTILSEKWKLNRWQPSAWMSRGTRRTGFELPSTWPIWLSPSKQVASILTQTSSARRNSLLRQALSFKRIIKSRLVHCVLTADSSAKTNPRSSLKI